MELLDLTFGDAANDVALDEALLESAESGLCDDELLRIWQPASPIVVLGRSSPYATEINQQECESLDVAVMRRCSGGAAILTAPGCLMYAVLLSYEKRPDLRSIDNAHRFVMGKIQNAIGACGVETQLQGICDLTIGGRKVSGNALRCKRSWFVYHGTLICQTMDIGLISRCLGKPRRQPEYRAGRSHAQFLAAIPLQPNELKQALVSEWGCVASRQVWPRGLTEQLVEEKYCQDDWIRKV